MKLVEAEIKNFKSFGKNDNNLFIDKLNVVIGKNESGKSNLIDALAGINSVGHTSYEYFNKKNRNTNLDIQLKLTFENYVSENKSKEKTYLTIESYENYTISGWLSKYIKENKDFNELYKSIMDLNEEGLSFNRYENQRNLNEIIDMLSTADEKIFIRPEYFKNYINTLKSSSNEKHKELSELLQKIASILESFYSFFPAFIKVDNNELRSKYNIQNIENDEVLKKFLEICDIKLDELKQIMTTDDTTEMRNYERDYNLKIKSNFTDSFTKFYSQENISIQIAINFKEISIIIDTSNRYLSYDERSNGLKWYLNLFIQLLFMERKNCKSIKNNIILIDEPGVYLHANAQNELYSLFKDLTKGENQIIYTTHSPFMINSNDLQNIRAVIKDEYGFSHIYNKITTIPVKNKSTYDTITPLVRALGMNLNHNIGPSFKKNNVIVEGMSDYFYLHSYFAIKKIPDKNRPNIIPSTGANNILPIASILYGWGCNFTILLDQDEKGREIYNKLKAKNHPFVNNILFVNGINQKSDNDMEIEDLFSDNDKKNFGINDNEYEEKKYNYSYITYNSILQGEKTFDKITLENFEKLKLSN